MNRQKPIYLMAGGRNSKSQEPILKSIFKDIGKIKPTVAYVGVANGDNWGFYLRISRMLENAGECKVRRVTIAPNKSDINKARATLASSDAIFMSGGDVEAGMQVLKEKNLIGFFVDLFQQGKLYFGTSAGSIMLSQKWVRWINPDDDSTAQLFPCLGIAPVICDTHAEEDDWEEMKAALKLDQENASGYGIPSGSCLKVYPDGLVEALGGPVALYLRQGSKLKKQLDLLPREK